MFQAMAKVIFFVIALAASAQADAVPGEARLSCRREPSPGRVSCELEVEVNDGRLVWVDALVIAAPDFALPLRSRVGDRSSSQRAPRRIRLPLALAATKTGRGELSVRARAVACVERGSEPELCLPFEKVATAAVEVGAIEQGR